MKAVGVTAAKVDLRKGEAAVTYDPSKTTPDQIARTITKQTGFATEVTPPK